MQTLPPICSGSDCWFGGRPVRFGPILVRCGLFEKLESLLWWRHPMRAVRRPAARPSRRRDRKPSAPARLTGRHRSPRLRRCGGRRGSEACAIRAVHSWTRVTGGTRAIEGSATEKVEEAAEYRTAVDDDENGCGGDLVALRSRNEKSSSQRRDGLFDRSIARSISVVAKRGPQGRGPSAAPFPARE